MTKESSDSDEDSDIGSTYASTYSSINNYHPLFDFNPYGPEVRSVTMKESVGNLIFRDLRHEQRRVAAMIPINRVEQPQHVKAHRTSLLPLTLQHPCSHLDPDGLCRDPSHRYLHQHPNTIRTSDIIHRLREGFSYIRDRNNELFHEQSPGTVRGWEKRTRFDAGTTPGDPGIARGQKGRGNKVPGYFYHDGVGEDSESESGIDDEESESDSEDKLHVKIPTEGDDRKGVRRLKGKNESKKRQKALDKVRKYAAESGDYEDEESYLTDRSHGKQRGNRRRHDDHDARRQSNSSDRYYDREVSYNWRDEGNGTPRGTFLSYNHGQAPNPVGKDYVSKLENGKIIRSPPRDRLFEKRNDVFTSNNGVGSEYRNNYVKERSDSFHRQSLSRKNTFEAEGGLMRVTSFVSEPSFCNCSSPGTRMSSRENSSSEECRRCGKRLKLHTDSSGVYERHGSGDYSRESSGEFVRERRDSGDYRVQKHREKSPVRAASPKSDAIQKGSKVAAKKSKKKRKIPKPGQAEDPDYMDKLRERLKDGEFDLDLDDLPSLDDINQKLHFDKEEEEEEDHYERKFVRPPLRYDQYRDAYLKALSVVRGKLLPTESWMFELNTTKSFVFSYFYGGYPKPRILNESRALPPPELPKKAKKGAEMKMIFGSENPDDYLPGGAKNPFPGQFATSPRKGKKGKKGGKKVKF